MPRIQANGIAIAHDCFGPAEAEPILVISGLGVQMIRWTVPFCALLAERGFRVIRFDNRDAGLSSRFDGAPVPNLAMVADAVAHGRRPDVPYTLHDMAADAVGLLDALGIARAHLVGRSMGGMVAQLIAARYPDRALSLTAIMSSTGNPALPPPMPAVMALLIRPAPDPEDDEAGFLAHSLALARAIAGPAHPFDARAHREQTLAELRRAHNPNGFGRQIAAIAATGDLRPDLKAVAVPTLVIHGADDPLVPPACGRDIARNIPGARLMIVDGMGHALPPELYGTVVDAIAGLRTHLRRPEGG